MNAALHGMSLIFLVEVGLVTVLAGAVAAVVGFGIGSLLTPLFAVRLGIKLAVAVVSIPHFVATATRAWMLRKKIDRRVLLGFGIASAAGGLAGALLHNLANNPALTKVFGGLLVFVGITGLTGLAQRMRMSGWLAWAGGALSGFLGGLVGNQGGIRSAAMLGMAVPKDAFVATATAIGVIVDAARMPVYLATEHHPIAQVWVVPGIATVGALVGTFIGLRVLARVPEAVFRRMVSGLILALGVAVLLGFGSE